MDWHRYCDAQSGDAAKNTDEAQRHEDFFLVPVELDRDFHRPSGFGFRGNFAGLESER
jgi:hypothetical protein